MDLDLSYSIIKETVHKTDTLVFQDISLAMLIVCLLGVCCTFFMAVAINDKANAKQAIWGTGDFFLPSLKNVGFHLVSALLTLTFIHEVGYAFVKYFIDIPLQIQEGLDLFFSAISGLGGGFIVAKIILLLKKKLAANA